jgi:hypothetical protein
MSRNTVRPCPGATTGARNGPVRESDPHRHDAEPRSKPWSILPLVAAAAFSWLAIWACVLAVMHAFS